MVGQHLLTRLINLSLSNMSALALLLSRWYTARTTPLSSAHTCSNSRDTRSFSASAALHIITSKLQPSAISDVSL